MPLERFSASPAPKTTTTPPAEDSPPPEANRPASTEPALTPQQRELGRTLLQAEQRFGRALLGGALAAGIGATTWATIAVVTNYELGWLAIGVGFLAGFLVQRLGKGLTTTYAMIGGGSAIAGVLIGKLAMIVAFICHEGKIGPSEVLSTLGVRGLVHMLGETFSPIDLLFYGLAVWGGWAGARRRVDDADIKAALTAARAN